MITAVSTHTRDMECLSGIRMRVTSPNDVSDGAASAPSGGAKRGAVIYDERRGETSLLENCVKQNDNSFLPMICLRLASVIFASKDNGRSYYLQPKSDRITLLDISE